MVGEKEIGSCQDETAGHQAQSCSRQVDTGWQVAPPALRPGELGPGCPSVNLPAGLPGAGSMCPQPQLQSCSRGCSRSPSLPQQPQLLEALQKWTSSFSQFTKSSPFRTSGWATSRSQSFLFLNCVSVFSWKCWFSSEVTF